MFIGNDLRDSGPHTCRDVIPRGKNAQTFSKPEMWSLRDIREPGRPHYLLLENVCQAQEPQNLPRTVRASGETMKGRFQQRKDMNLRGWMWTWGHRDSSRILQRKQRDTFIRGA